MDLVELLLLSEVEFARAYKAFALKRTWPAESIARCEYGREKNSGTSRSVDERCGHPSADCARQYCDLRER